MHACAHTFKNTHMHTGMHVYIQIPNIYTETLLKMKFKNLGLPGLSRSRRLGIFEKPPSAKLPQLVNLLLPRNSDIMESTYALVCVSDLGSPQQFDGVALRLKQIVMLCSMPLFKKHLSVWLMHSQLEKES